MSFEWYGPSRQLTVLTERTRVSPAARVTDHPTAPKHPRPPPGIRGGERLIDTGPSLACITPFALRSKYALK
jgi:hypothetical protein